MRICVALLGCCLAFPGQAAELKTRSLVAFAHQTSAVRTACFPPQLTAILGKLGAHFGHKVVVTSGYRAGGGTRRHSQHRLCKAADIRVEGVSPGTLAAYARKLPEIGGVGTYCGTGIVHVDVGPRRAWRYCH